jgi:predicted DCC family thiol-disulfide oxidoreductase YuxK
MGAAAESHFDAGATSLPERIVLFDGVCGFCHAGVRWVAARDPRARFRFAPLEGETAAALRARHPEVPDASETLVLVERIAGGERVTLRSRAVFRILRELETPWRHASLLGGLPAALTDLAYRVVAALRYRWLGRLEICPLPSPEERARFLA